MLSNLKLDKTAEKNIKKWLRGKYDDETKNIIQKWIEEGNTTQLTDSFYKNLEFGTGGMRGEIGVGSNRMNKYTVGAATQGLANYLNKFYLGDDVSVAIAYDSRNFSPEFARIAAEVLSSNGITAHLYPELRPTPQLSFTVRELGCQAGIVITASHNPREYNGYKVYWNDGSQVVAPHDKGIVEEVNAITTVSKIKFRGVKKRIKSIRPSLDKKYLKAVKSISVSPGINRKQSDLKIVFSSIHGTGITMVPAALEQLGFQNVHVVKEQAKPDGNFPTVVYPNPEEQEAMSMALAKAKEIDADLVLATDPDADRVGMAVKDPTGEWQLLNGNQAASLIIYYLLKAWKKAKKLTGSEFVAKTIVTTDLIDKMAEKAGVKCYNTLTGFKYIAQVIRETEGKETFIGGGEESYGYLIGDKVRDKDAVASCAIIAELTAYAKHNGISLFDFLSDMYKQYGFFYEGLISVTKKGKSGAEEIQKMMADFRKNPPAELAGSPVILMRDYKDLTSTNLINKEQEKIEKGMGIESSNVLQFFTKDGTKFTCRPSGTEPKIKFYVGVQGKLKSKEEYNSTFESLKAKVKQIQNELNLN
ncbi:phospho-sugar mutase [Jiulongibacter sediminis]|uniref:Phosphoglucomutase n=1 Tax=Jiulongibacter sediminis TaxID=1605367 RepID=A0A0N8H9Q4_9BACT|nr:phospho-sugar mutase [Jiulongibacter sediminis]KPM48020.1 phosphoglucomutase [Jiulongibacter sediminis]TBX24202.1 phosphoglucomutase [Jiulongibacter sediminis]